jgi:hypothetical protein
MAHKVNAIYLYSDGRAAACEAMGRLAREPVGSPLELWTVNEYPRTCFGVVTRENRHRLFMRGDSAKGFPLEVLMLAAAHGLMDKEN